MTEFISYSRVDTDFVRRLHERLAEQGRDIWVDWEDIPLTADWWQEIQQGIQSSNAFIFIISPNSVQSEICRDEIDCAVDHNKRIVPILHRELVEEADKAALHPALGSHNWIFFRDDDLFDAAFDSLVEALDTDIEHVHEHTRLLVRALEWEQAGRESSVLLNGIEITRAEAWLTGGMKLQPVPTDLQTQYIIASRKGETGRQRRILVGVTISLVIAIGLTIVSFFLFQLSVARQDQAVRLQIIAEDRGNEARSLALTANARNLISDAENNLGLTLAIAAFRAHNPPLTAVQRTLADAIYGPGARARLEDHSKSVVAVAFSPDGQTAMSISADGRLVMRHLAAGFLQGEINFGNNIPTALAISPDGDRFVTAMIDGTLRLWDGIDEVARLVGHQNVITQVAFSPDGTRILSGSLDRSLRLWDVASGQQLLTIDSPGIILDLAFAPDGQRAVTGSGDSDLGMTGAQATLDRMVRVWDLITGEQLQQFEPNSGGVRAVDFSPDGRFVAAGTWDSVDRGRLHIWRLATDEVERIIFGHSEIITQVAFSADSQRLFSASWDRTLRVWDIGTGLEIERFQGHGDRVLALAVSPDGEFVLTGTGNVGDSVPDPMLDRAVDPAVWLWDLESRAQIHPLERHDDWVWGVALSPDNQLAASGSGSVRPPALDSSVRLWDVETGEQRARLDGHTDTVQGLAFSPGGQTLASASWDGTVRLWDVETGAGRIGYDGHTDRILSVAFGLDGTTVFSASRDKTVHLWDIATGTEIRRFAGHTAAVNDVALSPDGSQLLTASDDRTVRLWDVETGAEIRQFIGHSDRVNSVAFSPDGTTALSASWDNSVRLWDVATGSQRRQFIGHNRAVFAVDFSPDGRSALTASADLTVRLWDTETAQEIRRYAGHTNFVLDVAFSADGRFALSGGEDNMARLWRVENSLEGLVAWAQANRYVPELTCGEREQFNVDPVCNEDGLLPTTTPPTE